MTGLNGSQPEQPQVVGPQPIPFSWQFGEAEAGGQKIVLLILHTVHGAMHYFLTPDDAKRFIAALTEATTHASSGLYIASGPIIGKANS